MPFALSDHPWESPLFEVSAWREKCMKRQVERCPPMPSGDIPSRPTPTKDAATCCPVYTKGGYSKPFPPYLEHQTMKSDNRFFQRQDFPTQTFLGPTPISPHSYGKIEHPPYNPMTYLYSTPQVSHM